MRLGQVKPGQLRWGLPDSLHSWVTSHCIPLQRSEAFPALGSSRLLRGGPPLAARRRARAWQPSICQGTMTMTVPPPRQPISKLQNVQHIECSLVRSNFKGPGSKGRENKTSVKSSPLIFITGSNMQSKHRCNCHSATIIRQRGKIWCRTGEIKEYSWLTSKPKKFTS